MTITDARLAGFQNTVGELLEKSAALSGLALAPTTLLGFAAESVFRLVRLGFSIRRARLEANRRLDEAVRLREIPREAIEVDLNSLVVYLYVRDGGFERDYPAPVAEQFVEEIREVRARSHFAVRSATKRILTFADRFLPQLLRDGSFGNPELQRLFGDWLDPTAPLYRRLFSEMAELFPSGELSEQFHRDRTSVYFSRSMENFRLRLDLLAIGEQVRLSETVRDLVWEAILGGGGEVRRVADFAVQLKKISLDRRLEALREELDSLDKRNEPERAADLERRIDELERWKNRL